VKKTEKKSTLGKMAGLLKESSLKKRLEKETAQKMEYTRKLKETAKQFEENERLNNLEIERLRNEIQPKYEKCEQDLKVLLFQLEVAKRKKKTAVSEKVALGMQSKAQSKKIAVDKQKFEQQVATEKQRHQELTQEFDEITTQLDKIKVAITESHNETKKISQAQEAAKTEVLVCPLNLSLKDADALDALEGPLHINRPNSDSFKDGFKRGYAVIQDFSLSIYESQEKKTLFFSISARSAVFLVLGTSVDHIRMVNAKAASNIFSIYEKNGEYNPAEPNADQMEGGYGFEITPAEDHLARGDSLHPTLFIAKNEYDKIRWLVALQNLRIKFLSSVKK